MSNRFTVLAGFLLLSVTSGSALAGASASCSATCPKGSCSIEIKEVEEPPVEGKSANPLGQDVIVRYVYNDPLDFARIELANQEALAVATLAIRKEIQRVIPSTAKHLDTLAAALEKGSIDGTGQHPHRAPCAHWVGEAQRRLLLRQRRIPRLRTCLI
jgi:hypothetical protein